MSNYFQNQELINKIGGNVGAWQEDEKDCECKNGKVCRKCQEAEDKYYLEE